MRTEPFVNHVEDIWGAMPNYIRPRLPGATIFFTVALRQTQGNLLVLEIDRLRAAFLCTQKERGFVTDAIVVLPDHLHAVLTLRAEDADFSRLWGAIKGRFSRGLAARAAGHSHNVRREKGIWQRRFWEHHIRSDADYEAHVRFCHTNPVKHGLVSDPLDWPYSSLHRDRRLGRA